MAKTKQKKRSISLHSDDELSFDPMRLIETSISSGFDPAAVGEIDERQMNWAPNVAAWIIEPEFLGIKTIYPHQLQILLRLFGDVCPYCSDWSFYQKDFEVDLKVPDVLDRIQLLNNGKCPKCDKTRLDHYKDGYWQFPHEIDLLWGMRSGKSAVAGMLGSYVLHRYLRIPDPASYFGLLKGSLLAMRFVALTAGQASETIWGQFQRSVENCNWFSTYHDFLKHYENKYGMELQKWLNTVFSYPLKGIFGYFLGASIDRSRGRTAIFSAFDEIGWWLGSKDGKLGNADETYAAYEKASRTIRNAAMPRFLNGDYNIPTALIAAVSSTSSKDDYIMRLVRGAKQDRKKVWSHKASWEVNPEFAANPDELREERDKNIKTFMRDYGSIPPYANNPFIDNEETVTRAAVLEHPTWHVSQEQGKIGQYLDAEKVEKNQTIPYCLAMDFGFNHCGYSAALLKLKEDDFSVVQVAGLFSIYPAKSEVIDLHQTFENFVKKMCDRLPIRLVLFDQWQSKSQIQSLQNNNVKAMDYSLTYNNFENFRSQLFQGKIEFVKPETNLDEIDSAVVLEDVLYPKPYLHFLWQLLSVSEVGNKVGKGEGHDDLFRAVVLGSTFMWNEDWRQQFEYKMGMQSFSQFRKGRLAMAGGSLGSGQTYVVSGGSLNTVYGSNKKAIGTVITRGGSR